MILNFSPDDITKYAVAEAVDIQRVEKALQEGKSLKVKLGIDPTSPDIHLGRSIPIWRLRAFQELGCEIHLIIGDFTGEVGDTSDKDSERPMLTPEVVHQNMGRYEEQLWMILNKDKASQVHFHHNSEWLSGLTFGDVAKLADAFSVNTFIKRELVARRLESGSRVSLREMLYPVMQGYDSVAIDADVELGGSDQWFNLLAGRALQEQVGKEPQAVITNPLINGLDGRKMSSSWGNVITLLDTPADKFGKLMSVHDNLMTDYLFFLPRSIWPFTQEELAQRMQSENPRDLKLQLAETLVALYHGEEVAHETREAYTRQFSEGQQPEEMTELPINTIGEEVQLVELLVHAAMAPSRTEARRLIEQGGVKLGDVVQTDIYASVHLEPGTVLQVGKRRFVRFI